MPDKAPPRDRVQWPLVLVGGLVAVLLGLGVVFFVLVDRNTAALDEVLAETEELTGLSLIRSAVDEVDEIGNEWEHSSTGLTVDPQRFDKAMTLFENGVAKFLAHAESSHSSVAMEDERGHMAEITTALSRYVELTRTVTTGERSEESLAFYRDEVLASGEYLKTSISELVAAELDHVEGEAAAAREAAELMRRSAPIFGLVGMAIVILLVLSVRFHRRRTVGLLRQRAEHDRALAAAGAVLIETTFPEGLPESLSHLLKASGVARGCFVDEPAVELGDPESRRPIAEVGVTRRRATRQEPLTALIGGADVSVETVVEVKSGERLLGWIGFVYGADDERPDDDWNLLRHAAGMIAALWDKTDAFHRLENVLRSKDEFLASVSHELRTPMTAVLGLASELASREFSAEETREFCRIIADQTTEVSEMLEDLLVAARTEVGSISIRARKLDLRAELDAVLKSPSAALRPDQAGRVIGGGVDVYADALRIRQIARNLISNARRYGGPRVSVELETRVAHAALRVIDDGQALTDGDAERIFERFFTTDRRGTSPGGVGLGLPVSRALARLMGGDLVYRREAGRNVFELTLPLAATSQWSSSAG